MFMSPHFLDVDKCLNSEMGATPAISWIGVLGYSIGSAFPAVLICFMGPRVKELSGQSAFSTADFAKKRYGRFAQLLVAGISCFYMFIFLVSELTSISNIFGTMVGINIFVDETQDETMRYAIAVAVITVVYTALGGLPASIVTDKFQGVVVALLVIILVLAVTTKDENAVSYEEFKKVSRWTDDGFFALVSLILAIASAEMFHQGNWQRVWAAKDDNALRKGFLMGSFGVFLLMMFFGIMGMLAVAKDLDAYLNYEKFAYLSFFDMLTSMDSGWNYIVLILITALCASSVDTLQNGLVSVFSHDILATPLLNQKACGTKVSYGSALTRALLIGINIPAVIMSAQRYDVLSLFLVADLVCSTAVLPVFLGLMTEPKLGGFVQPPTELGMIFGTICGVSAVLINGAVLDFDKAVNSITGETLAEGAFSYFWLTNGDICALCGTKTMTTFIVTPLAGGFGCLLFSKLDVLLRGDAAKKPLMESVFGVKEVEKFDPEYEIAKAKEEGLTEV